MAKLDRLGWAAGIAFTAYGRRIGLRSHKPRLGGVLEQLRRQMQRTAIYPHHGGGAPRGVDQAGQTGHMPNAIFHSGEWHIRRAVENERNAQFGAKTRSQVSIVLDGPLLGLPTGEWRGKNEIARGKIAFRIAGRQREGG